jgi:hypothetical protein
LAWLAVSNKLLTSIGDLFKKCLIFVRQLQLFVTTPVFLKKSGSDRSLSSPVQQPRGADQAPAQQDGQQSWLVAVDSVGARFIAYSGKKRNTIKASLMLISQRASPAMPARFRTA